MSPVWGIVGLGWLGSQVADDVRALGQKVWGTHRRTFDFENYDFPSKTCDVLLLNTPPLLGLSPEAFISKVEVGRNTRLIFISSTSVYGKSGGVVSEESEPNPETESAHWLCKVEKGLKEKFATRLVIIRPGGLIGGERHPIHSLSGRTGVPAGNHSVNLIHRLDLSAIILLCSTLTECNLLNAVAPAHPDKRTYYNQWAEKLNLAKVDFTDSLEPDRKVISKHLEKIYPTWKCPQLDFI